MVEDKPASRVEDERAVDQAGAECTTFFKFFSKTRLPEVLLPQATAPARSRSSSQRLLGPPNLGGRGGCPVARTSGRQQPKCHRLAPLNLGFLEKNVVYFGEKCGVLEKNVVFWRKCCFLEKKFVCCLGRFSLPSGAPTPPHLCSVIKNKNFSMIG